jgi:hypothetical protein
MRASDVIQQLQAELPKVTNLFSNEFSITSLTRSGSTVTAVTSVPHGLADDQEVLITGARELNPITSLIRVGAVASATTQNAHDLTEPSAQQIRENNLLDFNKADVSGADQADYNGNFPITSAVNRKSFTYLVSGSPGSPATGSPVLEQDAGYNGRFPVTVLDTTTFTYQITTTPISPAGGTIIGRSPVRAAGSVDLRRAVKSYTKQTQNKLWAFVVLGDVTTSRNRAILSDAVSEQSKADEYRNRLIEPFSVFIFIPGVDSLSGRPIRDDVEDIRGYIYKSLLGVVFPTGLVCETWSQTTPTGDRYVSEDSTDAYYIHEFSFQRVVDVTYPDTKGSDLNVAFRDVDIDGTIDIGTGGSLDADIDLDEQPLP